jgi:hypothetical protein
MRFRTTAAPAAALVAVAALLGACGSDGSKQELSNDTAASLRSTLDEVEQLVATRDCTGAAQEAAALRSKVDGLPQRVDGDLRRALASSADRLESLVAARCRAETQTTPEAPAGTTAEGGVQQPGGDKNQTEKPTKDKKPKKEKPKQDAQPPPDTGGAGQEDPGLNDQGGGTVPPGQ